MKYKGIELREFTSDKPVVFDPPRKMLVWDGLSDSPVEVEVYAFMPAWRYPVATANQTFAHCAEIPEQPEPRRATNRELAYWLAQGYGEFSWASSEVAHYDFAYGFDETGDACGEDIHVRKWDDDEWHEPTADYMGLED